MEVPKYVSRELVSCKFLALPKFSKRSLYLVIWRMTDGVKGLNEIYQWLINIQARAPNSPCIIVGTHFDEIEQKRSLFGNK